CSQATAEPVRIGVDLGATAVQKAASHAPIVTPGLHVDIPLRPRLSLGFQTTIGRFGESNPGGDQVTTPVRLSATVDGRVLRQTLGVYGGIGPALRVLPTRVTSDGGAFSGTRLRPGLRVRTGVSGDFGGRWQWGVGVGAVADTVGVDWDSLVSVSFALGRS
ncbi:MAG: hypothetical protein ACI855_004004, partial [Myxococcota bacterium]